MKQLTPRAGAQGAKIPDANLEAGLGGKLKDDDDDSQSNHGFPSGADKPPPTNPRTSAVAGLAYVATSSALILFNKHALSSFGFNSPNSLLFCHCLLSVLLVKGCEHSGLLRSPVEPLRWNIVRLWFPVNLLFVAMIVTSFFALKLIGVGMFVLLKNLSNLLTVAGDYFIFGKTYGLAVWACIMLMIASAAAGGMTDAKFSVAGYSWQLANCVATSGYALYLSRVMERVSVYTGDKQRLNEFSMVYYNNLLSLPCLLLLVVGFGEMESLPRETALQNPHFLVVAALGGLLGFAISFTSLWFISRSTATVYSLTGSMNKVIVAVLGIVLFRETASLRNLMSIAVGLCAATVFVVAKAYHVPPSK